VKAKPKAYLIMLGIFVAGVLVGAGGSLAMAQRHFAALMAEPRQEVMRERRLEGLARRLDLNDAQRDQIRVIMDRHGDAYESAMRDMFQRCGEKLRTERSKIDGEIKVVLDAGQRRAFDELSEHHRRRFLGAPEK
jgi:hypothetical protein